MNTRCPPRLAMPLTPAVLVSENVLQPSRKRRFADFQVYMQKPFDIKRLNYVVERLSEADGESVKSGSLDSWEAEQATNAANVATQVAGKAAAAIAAAKATLAASTSENAAAEASSKAPL